MSRVIVALFGICLCANGQFFGLATPADGSRVYFATPLRQKNTTQPQHGKLFQVDSSGLQLVLSRNEALPPIAVGQGALTNPYDLNAASVSADGKVFAAEASSACVGAETFCTRAEYYTTTITASGQSKDYSGHLQLSASGEWAFGPGTPLLFGAHPAYLFHVTTGEQVQLVIPSPDDLGGIRVAATGRAVADDGTVVYSTRGDIVTVLAGQIRRISLQNANTQDAVMDRSGRTIVFAVCGPACSIRLADSSRTDSSLLITDGYAPSLSDDGQTLLYLSNRTGKPQIRIYNFSGALDRQLANDQAGIAQAILSGDGSTVYAVTLGARLLKISVATRAVQELIPRTPYLTFNGSFPSPGKLTSLPGVGLTDLSFTADPPLPESINGIRVTLQGRTMKIQSVTPNAITVLVPPDIVPSVNSLVTAPVDVALTSPSPFDGPHEEIYIAQYAPEFLLAPGVNILLAAHQDWSALVSADNPARPGEVLHAYAVGLGDTSPAVPYGEAAPAREPFARVTIPIGCGNANNTSSPVDVLFQGLAPNLAGVYQIDLRVPQGQPDGNFGLYCVWGGIGSGGPNMAATIPVGSSAASQAVEER